MKTIPETWLAIRDWLGDVFDDYPVETKLAVPRDLYMDYLEAYDTHLDALMAASPDIAQTVRGIVFRPEGMTFAKNMLVHPQDLNA